MHIKLSRFSQLQVKSNMEKYKLIQEQGTHFLNLLKPGKRWKDKKSNYITQWNSCVQYALVVKKENKQSDIYIMWSTIINPKFTCH